MKFVFWSTKSNINQRYFDKFVKLTNKKNITERSMLDKLILSKFCKLTLVIGKDDTDILDKLLNNKLDRHITVITKDMDLVPLLVNKVSKIHILDYTLENMPTYWISPVSDYLNMITLDKLKKRVVEYNAEPKESGVITVMQLASKEINNREIHFISVVELSNKTALSYIKNIIKEENKKSKTLVKQRNKVVTTRDSSIKKQLDISNSLKASGCIEDYLVQNDYITEENLILEKPNLPPNLPIEQYLCNKGYFSSEDLVSILKNFLNQTVCGKEEFKHLDINYRKVKEGLKNKGVIEAYKKEDTGHKNRIIIVSYDCGRNLLDTITSTVNFSSLFYTIPVYMEEFK